MMRRLITALSTLTGLLFVAGALAAPGNPGAPASPAVDPGEGSCDVDGVSVAWGTDYFSALPAGFRVSDVIVSDISPTCAGSGAAVLTVQITGDGNESEVTDEIGRGSVVVNATTMTVPVLTPSPPPLAEEVLDVHVTLDGGQLPVPAECKHMPLNTVRIGTPGSDTIAGTQFRDVIFGQEGNDTISGLSNADCIDGGPDNDTLRGDSQDNVMLGGDGVDTIMGGQGGDTLYGGAQNDTLNGASGANTIFGGDHNDIVYGGSAKDTLNGGAGDDRLEGGASNDRLDGGPGYDRCYGGAGTDTFFNCEVKVQ